jgi:hypothetical protein
MRLRPLHILKYAAIAALLSSPCLAENYLVSQGADGYVKPSTDGGSERAFEAGDVIAVDSCEGDWCLTQNENLWVAKASLKPVRSLPGSVEVPKWGFVPKEMHEQAQQNCKASQPADCFCQDGANIGACGN